MRCIFFLFVVTTGTLLCAADQTATTADGRTVLLKDDGTWQYVAHQEKNSVVENGENNTTEGSLFEVIKNSAEFDFRSVRWGMDKKEVLAAEDAKLVKNEPEALRYEMTLFGYRCVVLYNFSGNRLTDAVLHIRQEHIDPELFYQDYENLKKHLEPIFGSSLSDKYEWKNDMYRSQRGKWGFAVSLGFLTCRTLWKTPRTVITLTIKGSNHEITTTMEYASQLK
ncbi:MAG: DUF3157 family protein [Chitinispirillaceae bacterium]|nr:DUF3157 family protein [Chitinispirillaceae bacterium]